MGEGGREVPLPPRRILQLGDLPLHGIGHVVEVHSQGPQLVVGGDQGPAGILALGHQPGGAGQPVNGGHEEHGHHHDHRRSHGQRAQDGQIAQAQVFVPGLENRRDIPKKPYRKNLIRHLELLERLENIAAVLNRYLGRDGTQGVLVHLQGGGKALGLRQHGPLAVGDLVGITPQPDAALEEPLHGLPGPDHQGSGHGLAGHGAHGRAEDTALLHGALILGPELRLKAAAEEYRGAKAHRHGHDQHRGENQLEFELHRAASSR